MSAPYHTTPITAQITDNSIAGPFPPSPSCPKSFITSYWGIAASGAFCFVARHFAKHYVWEVDALSPVAFKFSGHTFWVGKTKRRGAGGLDVGCMCVNVY